MERHWSERNDGPTVSVDDTHDDGQAVRRSDRHPIRTDGGEESPAASETGADGEGDDEPTVEDLLRTNDVLEPTPDGDDLQLTAAFERAWQERIEQLRGGDRAIKWLAAAHDADPEAVTVSDERDRFVVTHDGATLGAWHSRAGFLAAVVAEPMLREWVPDDRLAELPEPRQELAARLTMCLERCPACDEELTFVEREDGGDGIALVCSGCASTIAVSGAE